MFLAHLGGFDSLHRPTPLAHLAVERQTTNGPSDAPTALAGADDLFRQDLVQEGLVAIWDLDPSRFDEPDEGYFRRAVAVRMRLAARRERVQTHRRRVSRKRVKQAMEAPAPFPERGAGGTHALRGGEAEGVLWCGVSQ